MKKYVLFLFVVTALQAIAANKTVPQLKQVTIFNGGAQVQRTHKTTLTAGQQTLTFTGLSPYTDTKSLQVKASGRLTVLGVSYRIAHPDSLQRSREYREAESQLRASLAKQQELTARHEVIAGQMELVKTNCSVGSRTAVTPLTGIKELNTYYAQELLALKKQLLSLDDEQTKITEEIVRRQERLDSIGHIKLKAVTEVDLKVEVAQAGQAQFDLSYFVKGAGWFPSYDIRSMGISQPMQLSYKANIVQNTGEDWSSVPITLSSSNPTLSNVAPQLRPYWLNYGKQAPRYDTEMNSGEVHGTVFDETGTPIIGASVRIQGHDIGTVTDLNGRYSIVMPRDSKSIQVSFVGYKNKTVRVSSEVANVTLETDRSAIDEVKVAGYGAKERRSASIAGKAKTANLNSAPVMAEMMMEDAAPLPEADVVEVSQQQAQFGYEFEIKQPLTLPSNGKTVTTEIARHQLTASYEHQGFPRINREAFLVAHTTGHERLNLLEGEANVYFENTYVGKTIVDPTLPTDTLHFSLGRDNGIRLTRTKLSEQSVRRLLSSSQEQVMAWKITVRNMRREPVAIRVQDQLPVSENSAITVSTEELSGGRADDRGIVTWNLQLQPGEQRELILRYKVKYPKGRSLTIE